MKEDVTEVFEIDDITDRIEKNLQFLRDSLSYVEKYSSIMELQIIIFCLLKGNLQSS